MTRENSRKLDSAAHRLVRESAYNVARLRAAGEQGEAYSRAMGLYIDACIVLRIVAPQDATTFIQATYLTNPALAS